MTTRFSTRILVALCALTCASCKQSEPPPAHTAAAQPAAKTEQGQLVVYAAASLRDAFTQLGDDFKETHPGLEVTFNFAGSQELRTQIEHGGGADVFASADERQMSELRKADRVGAPVIFARNELVIVVANEQAATIKSIEDLPNAGKLVIGVADVPIGRYTLQLLDSKNVQYKEVEASTDVNLRREMIQKSGRSTYPQIFIGEEHVGGCDDIMALDRSGKLDQLLAA